ncbi:CDP-diacylglycerol--serine O-phosphatidyltransferase [bacterium]|nr:CDP-diacylglycerol--serine O-phosphatidyltransferase [bacterium]
MKNYIPNLITLGNLLCGFYGIVFVHSGNLSLGTLMVLAAAFLDFWDGFLARALNAKTAIGAQLDSFADLVSFGVLPALILVELFNLAAADERWAHVYHTGGTLSMGLIFVVYPIAAALRLAIFNVSTKQTDSFRGLPTPAAAMFISSFGFLYTKGMFGHAVLNSPLDAYTTSALALVASALAISALMLLPIPLISLKFKTFDFSQNAFRYLLILGAVILAVFFGMLAMQLIVLLYLLLSIIQNIVKK